MTYQIPLKCRPWLTGARYEYFASNTVIHFDLYAYMDGAQYWFVIEARQGGRVLKYQQALKYDAFLNTLTPDRPRWDMLTRLQWRRASNSIFKACHARLLALCELPLGYTRVSTRCHYLDTPDASPWPRDWSNAWKPRKARPGARPVGRPRAGDGPAPDRARGQASARKARPGDALYEREKALGDALERALGIEPNGRAEPGERTPRAPLGDAVAERDKAYANRVAGMKRARLKRALAHTARTGRLMNLL